MPPNSPGVEDSGGIHPSKTGQIWTNDILQHVVLVVRFCPGQFCYTFGQSVCPTNVNPLRRFNLLELVLRGENWDCDCWCKIKGYCSEIDWQTVERYRSTANVN